MMLSLSQTVECWWWDDRWIGKDVEGNSHGIIDGLSWHLTAGTDEW